MTHDPTAKDRAQRVAAAVGRHMYARDAAAQGLGIVLDEIRPGFARMTMLVRPDMLNGHATLHGGFSFALADTAFAYACNSHNEVTVAAGCSVTYPAPGRVGDRLTAVATETFLQGRNGVYDVAVANQDGAMVALFRGQARRIGGVVATAEEVLE